MALAPVSPSTATAQSAFGLDFQSLLKIILTQLTYQVNPGGGSEDAAYSYNSVGSQAKLKYRNNVVTTCDYNTRNQLTLMDTTGGGATASFRYDDTATDWVTQGRRLANSGQRRGMVENIQGTIRWVGYTYDSLNRLTKESLHPTGWGTATGTVQYDSTPGYDANGFDPVGNRQQRTISGTFPGVSAATGVKYDLNDRLDNDTLASTPSTYFDANGNTLKPDLDGNGVVDSTENAYSYGYDLDNRLTSANDGAGKTVGIVYDGDGNRVKKVVDATDTINDSTTTYLVDDRNPTGYAQVLEERDGGGNTLVKYLYGLDLVSQTRNIGTAGTPDWRTHYYGYDGLGSVRYLTGGSGSGAEGQVTATYTYDAFGILLSSEPTVANSYRYTGEQWDADLGMYYLRARYYKPELGRFWTMDTFEGRESDPLSLHKYLYCQGNPVNGIDPSGEEFLGSESLNLILDLPGIHLNLHFDWRKRVIVYVRADNDHSWICVENLDTGKKHTYGRWWRGYPRNVPVQAQTSGVNVDVELKRHYLVSRGIKLKNFTPTINAGYNPYNNNCATYAQSEWKRASGESLRKADLLGYWTFDHPSVLKQSILDKNGGVKEVVK